MAIITHYYCPKCKSEIKGLGWEEGTMNNCPNCDTYINNLNQIHLKVFNENIFLCAFILLLVAVIIIFSPKNTFVAYFFMSIAALFFAIMIIVLFLKRKTAKS